MGNGVRIRSLLTAELTDRRRALALDVDRASGQPGGDATEAAGGGSVERVVRFHFSRLRIQAGSRRQSSTARTTTSPRSIR